MPRRKAFSEEDLMKAEQHQEFDFEPNNAYRDDVSAQFDIDYPFEHSSFVNFLRTTEPGEGNQPWSNQHRLSAVIPSEIEVASFLRMVAKTDLKKAAALTIAYLAAARISEVLGLDSDYEGIRTNKINSQETDYGELLTITVPTLKRQENKKHQDIGKKYNPMWRTMPIPIRNTSDAHLWAMRDIIFRYMLSIESKEENTLMFERLKSNSIHRWLSRKYGLNCHLLRHWRLTHLSSMGLNEPELRALLNWEKKSNMPARYVMFSQDLAVKKMLDSHKL